MGTNFNHDSEQKKKNAWNLGLFGGMFFGVGTVVGAWESIWRLGFGPWGFSDRNGYFFAVHGTFSYLIHFIDPGYVGDLQKTWGGFATALVQTHLLEDFLATIWIPIIAGVLVFFSTWIWLYRAMSGTKEAGYIRGSRIKS